MDKKKRTRVRDELMNGKEGKAKKGQDKWTVRGKEVRKGQTEGEREIRGNRWTDR